MNQTLSKGRTAAVHFHLSRYHRSSLFSLSSFPFSSFFLSGRRYLVVSGKIASESIPEVDVQGRPVERTRQARRDTGEGARVVFEGDVSFVGSRFPPHPEVPQHNLRPSGPSLSHPSHPLSTVKLAHPLFHERSPPPISGVKPPQCRDVNAREMGWRGCENVAWPVTRVHAGKLFLFICSMLP